MSIDDEREAAYTVPLCPLGPIGDMGETIRGWQVHCVLPGTTDALEQQIIHEEWRREARLPARRVLNRDQAVRAKSPPVCPQ